MSSILLICKNTLTGYSNNLENNVCNFLNFLILGLPTREQSSKSADLMSSATITKLDFKDF